jgi:hypothetical protein
LEEVKGQHGRLVEGLWHRSEGDFVLEMQDALLIHSHPISQARSGLRHFLFGCKRCIRKSPEIAMHPADFGRRLPKKSSLVLFPLAHLVSYDESVTFLN